MEIFGFEINRKRRQQEDPVNLPSFVPPQNDDGAVIVTGGGVIGTYIDLEGTARTEAELITKYRELSLQPEIDTAIEEIVSQFISYDSDEELVTLNLDDLDFSNSLKKRVQEEFNEIIKMLDFNKVGYDLIKRWYVDGRLYFHVVIDEKNPHEGIQELRYIDPRKIRKIREVKKAKQTVQIANEYYLFSEKGFHTKEPISTAGINGLRIANDSIVVVSSGLMDQNNQYVLSYLHKAIKPMNQLRTLEDAAVIYRLSRAPERRIFYIDVGNLPKAKAEQYLADMMQRHKNRLVYDATTGELRDDRKYMTMLEDFWLPRREGGRGTEITTLPGGQNLGQMEDVEYFQKRLYNALHVPVTRLQPENNFNLGRSSEITREELRFAKFVDRLRMKFAHLFLASLSKQLILKGVIAEEESQELISKMKIDFVKDNYFTELKEAEILANRVNTAKNMEEMVGTYYSREFVRKKVLHQTDEDIEEINQQNVEEPVIMPQDNQDQGQQPPE